MKKFTLFIVIILLTLTASITSIGLTKDTQETPITIWVDGEKMELDTQPVIMNGSTLIPVRGVFEKIGITVDWNESTRQVIAKNDNSEILLAVDNNKALVNGAIKVLDTNTQIINQRAMIPVRFIAESFGYKVDWDGTNQRVLIDTINTEPIHMSKDLPTIDTRENLVALLQYNALINQYLNPNIFFTVFDVGTEANAKATSETKDTNNSDYSSTNNQVEGVDEADIIKTDGEFIYKLHQNKLLIIKASPDQPKVKAEVSFESTNGYPSELLLNNNKLIVIGNMYGETYPLIDTQSSKECMPYIMNDNTFVKVYDISDKSNPYLISDFTYNGSYVTSRNIDNFLYIITSKNFQFPYIHPFEKDGFNSNTISDKALLPTFKNNLTGEEYTIDYTDIQYFPEYVQPTYLMTIAYNLESSTLHPKVKAYLGNSNTIYVSNDSIYTALTNYSYSILRSIDNRYPTYDENTVIYKFDILEDNITYQSTGKVPGRILNQFSMDEYNGNFRIATTTGNTWSTNENISKNNIYILDEKMELKGKLENLAEGERIYSTRFMGDKIYMVTFKQIDPFFVIDASLPDNPKVLGYLKIPGYSTYLHPIDETHILGFGMDTYEENGNVRNGGLKLSLFDVTDFDNPIEMAKDIIGKQGTHSELLYNHKALMHMPSKELIAFPVSANYDDDYMTDFVGAYVYKVSPASLELDGKVGMDISNPKLDWYGQQISRILYIDNHLYTFTNGGMNIYHAETYKLTNTLNY